MNDLKLAFRQLIKNPGFTAVAVIILAVGIGANTAIFSVMDQVLIRPLPVRNPHQLALLAQPTHNGSLDYDFNYPLFVDYQSESDVFHELSATTEESVGIRSETSIDRRRALLVSDNYFSMLGMTPALGRLFIPNEANVLDGAPLVILNHQLWTTDFGGDPGVIGNVVSINDHPYTIIGVTPREFAGTDRGTAPDIYLPITMSGQLSGAESAESHPLQNRRMVKYKILGRLKPDIGHEQAQVNLQTLAKQIYENTPTNTATNVLVLPGYQGFNDYSAEIKLPLQLLFAIAALILLLICTNLANMQLARSISRRKEFAIRLALGARPWTLICQLLSESLLLAALGGGLGLLCAYGLTHVIEGFHLPQYRLNFESGLDTRVLWFGFGVSVLTGLAFGMAPAIRSCRPKLLPELHSAGAVVENKITRLDLRSTLVVLQVAMSMLILMGAGLCTRSLWKLYQIDPGFEPSSLVLMTLDATLNKKEDSSLHLFYTDILSRIRQMPGIESASLAADTPLSGQVPGMSIARVEGHEKGPDDRPFADFNTISSDYFRTLKVPIELGREFSSIDNNTSANSVIVDRTFVQRYLPNTNPIGKRIYRAGPPNQPQPVYEIIGVVGNTHKQSFTASPRPTMFLPTSQDRTGNLTLTVRTGLSEAAALTTLREVVRTVDPNVPVLSSRTMEQQLTGSLGLQRLVAFLLIGFGGLALILATLGVYGVLAYSVGQRSREFGIRCALGARVRQIILLVMRQCLVVVLIGMGIGMGVSIIASRLLQGFLYGIEPLDALTVLFVAFLLGSSAAVACLLPARRASRMNPMIALRQQ